MAINMEEEYKYLQMVINTRVFMQMENLKEMEITIGIMGLSIKVNLKMEFVMGMASGVMENKSIKVNILMIKGMDKVFINGMEEVFIKESFLMI